jgi:hypothetical protein
MLLRVEPDHACDPIAYIPGVRFLTCAPMMCAATLKVMHLDHSAVAGLWLNADASWGQLLPTGGCDEGCAGYIMVELIDAQTKVVLPGYEKEKCLLMNTTGVALALEWTGTDAALFGESQAVQARVYFRDATIYAIGSGPL